MRYSGREFSDRDIALIRRIIAANQTESRRGISRKVCEALNWRKPDGSLKDMSGRVALLRMERDGLIKQPPPKVRYRCPHRMPVQRSLFGEPKPDVVKPAGQYDLRLELVSGKVDSGLWNEFIDRYHYLGYCPLPGAQLRYFIKSGTEILALLGFGASAWKVKCRDEFIGWDAVTRRNNLPLVVNNSRFLILPWIISRNLSSRILSLAAKRLPGDWEERYHYRPVLLETFVEKQRFKGTSYRAANWICVGETRGRGRMDRYAECNKPVKTVWLYPLEKDFRETLQAGGRT